MLTEGTEEKWFKELSRAKESCSTLTETSTMAGGLKVNTLATAS